MRLLPVLILTALGSLALPSFAIAAETIEDFYKPELAPFYHGVASGDPTPHDVIIWTRVTQRTIDIDDSVRVKWFVAKDREMSQVVASGETFATVERDFTVKVDVHNLNPNHTYYYCFRALNRQSIIGRTKTAPQSEVNQLKFAVVSCANFEWGYFAGYEKISNRNDLDAVIHLGDYLYENPDNDESYSAEEVRDERVLFPKDETVSLKQYRKRYATYHLDPNLRHAHRQHPFIVIWDDHEFADNAWRKGADNHQPGSEGSWSDRKAAAKRAYMEWMPIREQADGGIYRRLQYGPLMDLILLDTRVEGRDKQIYDVNDDRLYDPERTILGGKQKDWLKDRLLDSDAIWKVIGNQVIFSEFNIGFAAGPDFAADELESSFLDIWDGYPAERHEIVRFLKNREVRNTVFLTGDIHASFAFEVADPAYDNPNYNPETGEGAVAVEFVTPSLSAANFDEEVGEFFSDTIEEDINSGPDNPNPHMKFADLNRHGYIVLSVDAEKVQADYYYLDNVLKRRTDQDWGAGFICRRGEHHLVKAAGPAAAKLIEDAPAP